MKEKMEFKTGLQEDKIMAIAGIGSSYNSGVYGNIYSTKGNETSKTGMEIQPKSTAAVHNAKQKSRNITRNGYDCMTTEVTNVREMTIKNTNEVAWEHYTAMRDISSLTLKDGNYTVEDVMKSIMDTYEIRYNEIVKEHENRNREVSYKLTGKRSLTLDEDLAGLDEAFKMRLANLEGYITCQQTNKAFENPDSSWYFRRNSPQKEGKTQDKVQMFDKQYQQTAVAIMEQAREKFLAVYESINYKRGTAVSILSDIMKKYW